MMHCPPQAYSVTKSVVCGKPTRTLLINRTKDKFGVAFSIHQQTTHQTYYSVNGALRTCDRDRATSGVDAGTSSWCPSTARCVVSCLRSGRPSVRSRDSAGARLFHRQSFHGISDRSGDSPPELCPENAICDPRLQRVRHPRFSISQLSCSGIISYISY